VQDPAHKVIWNLQAMKEPKKNFNAGWTWTWNNGIREELSLKTLLPEKVNVELFSGDNLYVIDGINHPPQRNTGPAPECRIEISPLEAKKDYVFVHVLYVHASNAYSHIPRTESVKINDDVIEVALLNQRRRFVFKRYITTRQ